VIVACSDCAAIQQLPRLAPDSVATCRRCGRFLDRGKDPSIVVSFAWSAATLLLLIAANGLPVLSATLKGSYHRTYILSGCIAVWQEGWPLLGLILGGLVIVFPLVWSGLLTLSLGALVAERRPAWLGRAFRYARTLHLWSMPDVLVVAGFVIYIRVTALMRAAIEPGGWCLIAAGVLALLVPRVMAPQAIWRAIAPDVRATLREGGAIACIACELAMPAACEGEPCPRCSRPLRARKPDSVGRTSALVATAYLLFFPAYYLPMSLTMEPTGHKEYTVFLAMRELFRAGYWYLGIIIVCASFVIPLLKLAGLTWLVVSVRRRSRARLVLKTRLHRLIYRIGRWSNVDPLIVALSIPLMSLGGFVQVHAAPAALPFTLIVLVTMLATRTFDSRLLWDAERSA